MEKCGKLWREQRQAADGNEVQGAVYLINGADATIVMGACSACAGDYEDPDRTAWAADDAEDEERDGTTRATTEEFPAKE